MLKSTQLLFALSLFASSAVLAAPHLASFAVPNHGSVELSIPDGWASQFNQPEGDVPPTVFLAPKNGQPFEVYVNLWWPTGDDQTIDESALQQQVADSAKEIEDSAAATDIQVREMTGIDGHGYYFTVTDPAPQPDEFKYMAKGLLKLDSLVLAFSVFTNDGQADVVEDALKLLTTAEHK